jgi:putative phosphoesterase
MQDNPASELLVLLIDVFLSHSIIECMKIGLLSDTHGYIDPKIFDYFKDCDEIWHGGDIGDIHTANQLEAFKPLKAVYGNIDDKNLQIRFPEDLRFICGGLSVWITHIGGTPPKYNPRVRKLLAFETPDIFICGHSHILRIKRDPTCNNMLYINPGAAGNHGFHHTKTILRFSIDGKEIKDMEAIELGKRGAL